MERRKLVTNTIYNLSLFSELVLFSFICNICNFKFINYVYCIWNMSQVDPNLEKTPSTAAYEGIEDSSLMDMVWQRRRSHICHSSWIWHSGSLRLKVLLLTRSKAGTQRVSLGDVATYFLLLLQNLFPQPINVSIDIQNWNLV